MSASFQSAVVMQSSLGAVVIKIFCKRFFGAFINGMLPFPVICCLAATESLEELSEDDESDGGACDPVPPEGGYIPNICGFMKPVGYGILWILCPIVCCPRVLSEDRAFFFVTDLLFL